MIDYQLKEKIIKSLNDAFRKQADLEQMFQLKLGENLFNYVGNYGLNHMISEVVDKFDSQNRLDELVIGAIRMNPNNSDLQNLVSNIKNINNSVISHELSDVFDDLLKIIRAIEFPIIEQVIVRVLSDKIKDKIQLEKIQTKFKDLENLYSEYSRKTIQFFIIKKLLLVEYETLSDGTKTSVLFAHYLANSTEVEQTNNSQELKKWVKDTVNKYNLKSPTFVERESPEVIRVYLLIIIKPENNQYRINAYLIPNEEDKENIEPLDIELAEKGILCTFDKIREKVPEFIKKSETHIINNTTRPWELTIEFFLPIDHLNAKVEQWQYAYDDDLDDTLLGEKCRVVVRSSDRLQRGDWIRALRFGIERLKNVRSELNDQIIQDKFVHLTELNSFNWKILKNTLEKDKIGLKLSCPLPPVSDEKYKELFKAILISGIPIAVWKRSSIPNMNPLDEFNKFLNVNSLSDCSKLFKLFLEERKLAYQETQCENYLGYHLGVLCEEPNLEEFPDLKAAIANL